MSGLTTLAEHARTMATAEHVPDCEGHAPCRWGWQQTIRPNPACTGCVTDSDRALWTQIADEIEAHLGRPEEAGLFG